jgi:hypothetical protein
LDNVCLEASVRPILIAILFALFAGTVPAALALAPRAASPVAVVVAPWAAAGEASRIVAAVNGTLVGATHGGTIAIAQFDSADFVAQLYHSGALLVLDAAAVTACLSIDRKHSARTRITS